MTRQLQQNGISKELFQPPLIWYAHFGKMQPEALSDQPATLQYLYEFTQRGFVFQYLDRHCENILCFVQKFLFFTFSMLFHPGGKASTGGRSSCLNKDHCIVLEQKKGKMTHTEVFGQRSQLFSFQQTHNVSTIKSSMTSVVDSCQCLYHSYFPAQETKLLHTYDRFILYKSISYCVYLTQTWHVRQILPIAFWFLRESKKERG